MNTMSMRPGNRKARKSIAIIGEGLTEYRYVDDMRTTERYRFSLVPGIPKHSDVDDIGSVWCQVSPSTLMWMIL